jgi:hypothetical protein
MRLLVAAMAIGTAYPALAAPVQLPDTEKQVLAAAPRTNVETQTGLPLPPGKALGEIVVESDANNLPGDGRSTANITIRLFDADGAPLAGTADVSVQASAGRIVDTAAPPRLKPGPVRDGRDSSIRVKAENGIASLVLVAPSSPQHVTLRVSSGVLQAQGEIKFVPDVRPIIVSGLAEGILSHRSSGNADDDARAGQARFNDGFEQTLSRWSRRYGNGRNDAAARLAMFAKGEVGGGTLLTGAYDSEKAEQSRLLRDIDPNTFYPVYGDDSITGFDALSSERLYLRLDRDRSYLLYGDFATGDPFGQFAGAPSRASVGVGATAIPMTGVVPGHGAARSSAPAVPQTAASTLPLIVLGQYKRTATGLRGHFEQGAVTASGFAIDDTLRQMVEEYPANGTSGPFAVRSNAAIQNSEKIELLVRDKNQVSLVTQVVALQRYVDYSFEPLSGRILFNQPIASLSPNGDPQSIRISYEVDQGGERFWVLGADASVTGERLSVGAAAVNDNNPDTPYKLHSIGGSFKFGEATSVVTEIARSHSISYTVGSAVYAAPSGQAGEMMAEHDGTAGRVELRHSGDRFDARAYWLQADRNFDNISSGLAAGRTEGGASGKFALDPQTTVFAEAVHSADRGSLEQADAQSGDAWGNARGDARRNGQRAGVLLGLSERLDVELSLRHVKESGNLPTVTAIASNTAQLGASASTSGGFLGSGTFNGGSASIDPLTGLVTTPYPGTGANASQYSGVDATTARVGAQYRLSERFSVNGDAEHSIAGENQHRYGAGVQYTSEERRRIYARAETQRGLASSYSLAPADRGTSFIAGVDSPYMEGGTVFSEYRLRDGSADGAAPDSSAAGTRNAQLASGVRNTWQVSEGITAGASAEYLKVLDGAEQQAAAVTGSLDYRVNPAWSASAKLELRKLYDRADLPASQAQDQWLNTVALARRISGDWTLLARNYLLYQRNHADATGAAIGNTMQNRAQLGFAWRPLDNNLVNGLARYEYKTVRDRAHAPAAEGGDNAVPGEYYDAHIVSAHLDYHPSRAWWMTSRVAGKRNSDMTLPAGEQKYTAVMAAGRAILDLSPRWDIGVLASVLYSPQGHSRQFAYGAEAGYRFAKNMYLSVGHNLSGFYDRDLSGSEYTARGTFLRLRVKFDENSLGLGTARR